jgi:putative hemolysin
MHPPAGPQPDLHALTEINVDDLLDALGLARWRLGPLRRLFRPAARRFAHIAAEFDRQVARHGLAEGSAWMVRRMAGGLDLRGLAQVPVRGPLCVLANHPGMTDTVALISALAVRPDLRVIALDRPFLRALPAVAPHLIFVPDGGEPGRLAVVRAGVAHLQRGGALLTFPAAHIEPDPAVFGAARARASLADWSPSFAVFARRVPGTVCIPALVSHVLSVAAQDNPLTRLRRQPVDREKLAAALQVSMARYQRGTVRVAFGAPPHDAERDSAALHAALLGEMARLIDADVAPALAAPAPRQSAPGARVLRER